jgi:hypothetical protein
MHLEENAARAAGVPPTGRAPYLVLAAIAGLLIGSSAATSAPIYIGAQILGVNGSAIDTLATGSGTVSYTGSYQDPASGAPLGAFGLTIMAEGTPPLPEPELNSSSLSVVGEHDGTVSLFITETNQMPKTFASFFSDFSLTGFTDILTHQPATGAGITVVESTYLHVCGGSTCNATSDVYALSTLLSTTTLTSPGTVDAVSEAGLPIVPSGDAYAITEVYTLTFAPTTTPYTQVSASIDESVPEPASIAILGSGLIGLRLLRRRAAE